MNITVTAKHHSYPQPKAGAIAPVDGMTLAVEAYRTPSRFRGLQELGPLGQVLTVIKAAAGDEKVLAEQATIYRMAPAELQEAAKHLLLRHLMRPDISGNQLLGLPEEASLAELKDHKRWLLKWLHPDRNPSAWEQKLFHRINDYKPGPSAPSVFQPVTQHVTRTQKARVRRGWALAHERKTDASPRQVFFRVVRSMLIGVACVIAVVWLVTTLHRQLMM